MFKKLDLKLDVPFILLKNEPILYDEYPTYKWRGTVNQQLLKKSPYHVDTPVMFEVYNLKEITEELVLKQLPKELLDLEVPEMFYVVAYKMGSGDGMIEPHIDRGRRCAINLYLNCSGQVTTFYDDDLNAQGHFIGEPDDVWALNVSQPHSVTLPNQDMRTLLSLSFKKIKFEKLIDVLT